MDISSSIETNIESDKEEIVLQLICNAISDDFKKSADIFIVNNKGDYNSIIIKKHPSVWTNNESAEFLYARLKTKGNSQYISFAEKCEKLLKEYNVKYYKTKSDSFCRIDLDYFIENISSNNISDFTLDAFKMSCAFYDFGCCHKHSECEITKICTHADPIYSLGCQLRKRLKIK